ncbi:MAG TPA: Gfo/Idh/MocA family oxidoreductase [Gemmatimonadota bacterium]|nr:Gfo/Idh/MocA family oxidoreductase [Gemmatimonadota bacterium]
MATAKTPRIACIGAGAWGANIIRNFSELGALDTICDARPQRLEELAARYPTAHRAESVDQVIQRADIAGVAIATPAETHGRLVRQALLAGKDVLVEKPLCLSVPEGRELVALARERGRVLMVGHLLWYHPAVLKLKEMVSAGELGRVQYIYSNRLNLGRIRREENILWSFAPHDISVILGLLDEMPDGVEAQGGNYLHPRIADVTTSLLSFPSGVKAHIFVSWLHPFKEQKLVVVGDKKMAVFDDTQEVHNKLTLYPHSIEWNDHVPIARKAEGEPVSFQPGEPLRAECEHFLECIEGRGNPRTDGEEALRVLTVLDACQRSLERVAVGGAGEGDRDYFVHDSSYVDDDVTIGRGTRIWHFSHVLRNSFIGEDCRIGQKELIGPNVEIGNGVKIQNNVSVYEGVTLEDHVFCGPSMVFTNVVNPRSEIPRMDELRPTLVRRGATLGANCTVLCGTTVGQYAFVAAGAVSLMDVPDYALVAGVPGKIIGWMCRCGYQIEFAGVEGAGACKECGHTYHKTGEQVTAT